MSDSLQSSSHIPDPVSPIRKVGIIGEGKMGTGIFYYLLDYNYDLVWLCSPKADCGLLMKQFGKRIKRSMDAGIIDLARFTKLLETIITNETGLLHDCDLIIEAIPENLILKKNLFEQLDGIVKPEAVFTSNTSSINPSEISPRGIRNGKFAGLHFFYPLPLKNIAELLVTSATTVQTRTSVEAFLGSIHRPYLLLEEKNSFILNKIFLDFQNEASIIVREEHCTVHQMDQLVKKHFFPFGVFDFCDSVGIDTMLTSVLNYTKDHPFQDHYGFFITLLKNLVAEGKLGMKAGEGFYKYPVDPSVAEEFEGTPDIVDHLRQTWLSTIRRFTAQSHIPIDDMNSAVKEYFGIEHGPFE